MARYAMAIDISRCSGCGSCFLACKDEYIGNDYKPYSLSQPRSGHQWLDLKEVEQGEGSKVKVNYIPLMCQHCVNPPCAKNAPDGAVVTRADGIVTFDLEKAKGCQDIMKDCPFGVVFWNEENNLPQKCGMCAHMLDGGEKAPRCVESCPTSAMFFGDIDDPNSEISKYLAERGDFTVLKPDSAGKTAVLYRELPSPFITGEIAVEDKSGECLEGASVCCAAENGDVIETKSDFLGDFQFKGLSEGGKYTIRASYPGYKPFETTVVTDKAKDLGLITLKKN